MNPFGSPFQQFMQQNAQQQAQRHRQAMGSAWLRMKREQEERERQRAAYLAQTQYYLTDSPSPRPLTFWQRFKEWDRKCDEQLLKWLGLK